MLRFPLFGSRARSLPRGTAAVVALACSVLVSSCLTPNIDFGDSPAITGGTTGDGGSPGPETGGANGTGAGNFGGGGGLPPLPDHCTNGVKDEDETDRNCG